MLWCSQVLGGVVRITSHADIGNASFNQSGSWEEQGGLCCFCDICLIDPIVGGNEGQESEAIDSQVVCLRLSIYFFIFRIETSQCLYIYL